MNEKMDAWTALRYLYDKNVPSTIKRNYQSNLEVNDRLILILMPFFWLTSLGITLYFDTYWLGFLGGGAITALAFLSYHTTTGLPRRAALCLCLGLFGVLFIQQQPGYIEPHFEFYAGLYILTRYKDIVPLLIFVAFTLTYYTGFTYLQSIAYEWLGMPIKIYTWGLWNAYAFHTIAFVATSGVFVLVILNHVRQFIGNQNLQAALQEKKAGLDGQILERTAQLAEKTEDLDSMLHNLSEGLLMVLSDKTIHPEYSSYLESILGTDEIARKPLLPFLFSKSDLSKDALSAMETVFDSCLGEESFAFDMNQHLLVTQCIRHLEGREQFLEFDWNPIVDAEGMTEMILVSIRDVTLIKQLQKETQIQNRTLQIIGQILAVTPESFNEFIQNALEFTAENKNLIEGTRENNSEVVEQLFRNMHTIKGNARMYGLQSIIHSAHDVENEYDELRKNLEREWDSVELLAQLSSVQQILEEYNQINRETLKRAHRNHDGVSYKVQLEELDTLLSRVQKCNRQTPEEMQAVLEEIRQFLGSLGASSLEEILSPIIHSLASLAEELQKPNPSCSIHAEGIKIHSPMVPVLKNGLTHVFRNSLDHGIESPETRLEKGKPEQGQIELRTEWTPEFLVLKYHDDGQGLNLERIHQKAIEKQLLKAEEQPTADEIGNLIFHPGFSTAQQVTEISGRGVGMDAVKKFIEAHQGSVDLLLMDHPSEGSTTVPFELHIKLPVAMAIQN